MSDTSVNTTYRTEFEVADGSPSVWYTNGMRYGTVEEATEAALNKAWSWLLVVRARVVSDDTPEREPVDRSDERIVFGGAS